MEKVFKHRKTGEIAYYKDGILKSGDCCIEIGVEPSSDIWEKPIWKTEDGVDVFERESVAWVIRENFKYTLPINSLHIEACLVHKDTYKVFSSEISAKNYLRNNEKKYSLNDMVSVVNHWAYIKNVTPEKILKYLENEANK